MAAAAVSGGLPIIDPKGAHRSGSAAHNSNDRSRSVWSIAQAAAVALSVRRMVVVEIFVKLPTRGP